LSGRGQSPGERGICSERSPTSGDHRPSKATHPCRTRLRAEWVPQKRKMRCWGDCPSGPPDRGGTTKKRDVPEWALRRVATRCRRSGRPLTSPAGGRRRWSVRLRAGKGSSITANGMPQQSGRWGPPIAMIPSRVPRTRSPARMRIRRSDQWRVPCLARLRVSADRRTSSPCARPRHDILGVCVVQRRRRRRG